MSDTINQFYECDNPECRLRFPGSEGNPRWNRCPLCRSHIHSVASVIKTNNSKNSVEKPNKYIFVSLLDNIRSALNVGSIFRTSDGMGIRKLYLCGITPSPENPTIRKSALGAENDVNWEKSNNGLVTATHLKSQGHILWALENIPSSEPLYKINQVPADTPIVIIIGNEVSGVDPGIIDICDKVISIPMVGKKHSYNVAVAFGIAVSYLLYQQWRQIG